MAKKTSETSNVAVIGAGILGVACALHLQRLGQQVIMIDKAEPGEGASGGNAGILAASSVVPVPVPGVWRKAPRMLFGRDGPLFVRWRYLPRLLPWLIAYLKSSRKQTVEYISANLAPLVVDCVDEHLALAGGTPAERWIKRSPYLFVYPNVEAYRADAFGWRLRREAGFEGEQLEGDALHAFEPAVSRDYKFGVVLRNHAIITNPGAYVKDLAKAFEALGGRIEKAEIRDVHVSNEGILLTSAQDQDIAADKLVLAAGAWSGKLARQLGSTVPLESERGYHIDLIGAAGAPSVPVMDAAAKIVATPMDKVLRVAGLVEFAGLEAPASKAPIDLLVRGARRLLPGLRFKEQREWLGHRPAPSDSLPVLGRSPKHANVFFAFGHHHVGLTAGPKSGRVVAQQIVGLEPNIDLTVYRADRVT